MEILTISAMAGDMNGLGSCVLDISAYVDPVKAWWIVLGFLIPAILGLIFGKLQERVKSVEAAKAASEESLKREKSELMERMDRMEAGQRYLLKDRLLQACAYWQKQRYCPAHARETITDMFGAYKAHGGNSFVHEEVSATFALPHMKPENMEVE